eukprot:Opistho-2@75155
MPVTTTEPGEIVDAASQKRQGSLIRKMIAAFGDQSGASGRLSEPTVSSVATKYSGGGCEGASKLQGPHAADKAPQVFSAGRCAHDSKDRIVEGASTSPKVMQSGGCVTVDYGDRGVNVGPYNHDQSADDLILAAEIGQVLLQRNEMLEKELEKERALRIAVECENETLQSKLKAMTEQQGRLIHMVRERDDELHASECSNARLEGECEDLQQQKNSAVLTKNLISRENAELEAQIASLTRRLRELEDDNKQLKRTTAIFDMLTSCRSSSDPPLHSQDESTNTDASDDSSALTCTRADSATQTCTFFVAPSTLSQPNGRREGIEMCTVDEFVRQELHVEGLVYARAPNPTETASMATPVRNDADRRGIGGPTTASNSKPPTVNMLSRYSRMGGLKHCEDSVGDPCCVLLLVIIELR